MKKLVSKITCLTCSLLLLFTCFACTPSQTPNGDNVLEVMIWDAGYGIQWCEDMLESFKEEPWVKEKYPNLVIDFDSAMLNKELMDRLDAGESSNTVDLFFTGSLSNYQGKDSAGKEQLSELTNVVYNTKVPGEDVTVLEKMLPSFSNSIMFYEKGQDSNMGLPFRAYVMPWATGEDIILYNETILNQLGLEVPLTTDQFIETCKAVTDDKTSYNKGYAIIRSNDADYWQEVYPTWWAQYEGYEEYCNFYNGVHDGMISSDIYRQKGKLYSLEVLEKILDWTGDYSFVYKQSVSIKYMVAQTQFLLGDGVFMANGDWFDSEMVEMLEAIKDDDPNYNYKIRLLKTPILSKIIEKTPTITSEEMLREVVRAIDAGHSTVESAKEVFNVVGVSQKDYQKILDARGMVHTTGPNTSAAVPTYAEGKEIAFDFLRYMATDKAQVIYARATGGATLPFNYNIIEKNPELYDGFYQIQKDRLDHIYNQCYETQFMPLTHNFPLVKWGGMSAIKSATGTIVSYFAAKNGGGTAKTIYDNDIEYYITQGYFARCCSDAGIG